MIRDRCDEGMNRPYYGNNVIRYSDDRVMNHSADMLDERRRNGDQLNSESLDGGEYAVCKRGDLIEHVYSPVS